jgi:hypothetical protein
MEWRLVMEIRMKVATEVQMRAAREVGIEVVMEAVVGVGVVTMMRNVHGSEREVGIRLYTSVWCQGAKMSFHVRNYSDEM